MREGGIIAGNILHELLASATPGVTTQFLDEKAQALVKKYGVKASFKGFEGYQHHIVTCVNDEVVHGIPSKRVLEEGDLLTIDFGAYYKGFHTDTANTIEIGNSQRHDTFLSAGKQALETAIQACRPGNHIGDIGYAIESVVYGAGYDVVWQFVGHGVGKSLHEDPQVPGMGEKGTGVLLREGMVLAVEVMYAEDNAEVEILDDGWTAVTVDRSNSGMFEHTVALTKNGPLVITAPTSLK